MIQYIERFEPQLEFETFKLRGFEDRGIQRSNSWPAQQVARRITEVPSERREKGRVVEPVGRVLHKPGWIWIADQVSSQRRGFIHAIAHVGRGK